MRVGPHNRDRHLQLFDDNGTLQLIDSNGNPVENLTLLQTNAPCFCAGSVTRERAMPETFTYYHIELADHALILANGMAADTFVDNVDRMGFDNWAEHEALFGTDAAIVEMAYPRAKSARQVPAATRARLLARAGQGMAAGT